MIYTIQQQNYNKKIYVTNKTIIIFIFKNINFLMFNFYYKYKQKQNKQKIYVNCS